MIKPRVFWQIGDIARSSNILVSTVRKVLQAAVTSGTLIAPQLRRAPSPVMAVGGLVQMTTISNTKSSEERQSPWLVW